VPVADLAYSFEVAVGRDKDPVGARDRLEDERGDGAGAFEEDRLIEHRERYIRAVGAPLDAMVGVEDVDHAHRALVRPAARVAGRLDRGAGGAVVRAVSSEDLGAAGDCPGDLDGVLVRVVAAKREQDLVDVAG